jgi:hypothetical protein
MRRIREIVESNSDIKVWNVSLGSDNEINPNFVSTEAAILDRIQSELDVIFIIAGTNKKASDGHVEKMIGAPADSINGIIVNSVNAMAEPASYSRRGLVLSFFNKPDISTFGGDKGAYMRVCTPLGESYRSGTSYAAPWITRKVAFLIEIMGFTREVAKALIVDAAAGWNGVDPKELRAPYVGHGIVPQRIEDVIQSKDDEIKFVINGVSEKWETYSYQLPVPIHNKKHPFVARATLCYFPSCSRNQGVDYTNSELDVYFGRVKGDGIKSIDKNVQNANDGEIHYVYEGRARTLFRKWDNTKHICERLADRPGAREVYGAGMWGISVKAKERLSKRDAALKFGLVITLKEIKGVNRIDDFVRQCELRGWLVSRVEIRNRLDIYNKAQGTVAFS